MTAFVCVFVCVRVCLCVCVCFLQSFSDTLLNLTPRLYHDLTGEDPENVPLPWLFVAYQYMQDNHQHLYNLYLQNNGLVAAGEATEVYYEIMFNFLQLL